VEEQLKIVTFQAEAEALRLPRKVVSPELIRLRKAEAKMKPIDKGDGNSQDDWQCGVVHLSGARIEGKNK